MNPVDGPSFSESDFEILVILVERYTLSTVIAALSRICLRWAERTEIMVQGRDAIREWRKDAGTLTKALIQLHH
ncbi:hypothetical protein [Leptolyngbya sp. FACHB-261]|uniref:hypothetical protein n=1 Tax=Leptolyngbya sp. FACHB-261 TaxID=2692806 RepID=UPI0016825A2C|nr:hypothetical protein [Leptolyngbya sp. FACHB-261]MBD2103261.1 hypothetical protein [Leptolyngbya sp. FACHB-261]